MGLENLSAMEELAALTDDDFFVVANGGVSADVRKISHANVRTSMAKVNAVAVANVAALTSSAATGGDAPTEAEYNALRTDVAAVRTTLNALLASLRTPELIDT